MSEVRRPDPRLSLGIQVLSSSFAAVVSTSFIAPVERVKLLLQCQNEMIKTGRLDQPYKGAIDCTVRTFRNEGFLAFWRGNLTHCIMRAIPTQALTFMIKDKLYKSVIRPSTSDAHKVGFAKNFAVGGAAGLLSLAVIYSLDYTRVRLANDIKTGGKDGAERQFKGMIDVYRKTIKADGFRGLYRGFATACVGIVWYRGAYFGLYDTLKPFLLGDNAMMFSYFALGTSVTMSAGLLSYPIDTIVRRLMMTSGEARKYKGAVDCAQHILRNEGPIYFMKGLGVSIFKGIIGGGLLGAYEMFKRLSHK